MPRLNLRGGKPRDILEGSSSFSQFLQAPTCKFENVHAQAKRELSYRSLCSGHRAVDTCVRLKVLFRNALPLTAQRICSEVKGSRRSNISLYIPVFV